MGDDLCSFVVDDGWLMMYVGAVQVVWMEGRPPAASFARYVDALATEIDRRSRGARVAVIYCIDMPDGISNSIDAGQRKAVTDVLAARQTKLRETVAAYALVTGSSMVRTALRAMFWFAPPPYPNKVVATVREAAKFAAEHLPSVDVNEVERAFEHERSVYRRRHRHAR